MRFEFATAARVLFGPGTLQEVGPRASRLGERALVVTGASARRADALMDSLVGHGIRAVPLAVPGEPTTDAVREGTALAREAGCDLVIGFGGGSAIDAGKAIAALLANGGDPLDYLEVVGRGQALSEPSRPFVAIPTTAGTGAEVTANAVLASPEHRVKASLRSPLMLPTLAIVDPELTWSMPPAVTAATGLDALTQLIEPFVSLRSNPIVDTLCREGLARVARSLRRACERGDDPAAREDMAFASLLGGMALANAGLGAVHGFAGPLGGVLGAPHGALCACLLPHVMAANLQALTQREPESPAFVRYRVVACILTGAAESRASDGVAWVAALVSELGIPPLSRYGLREDDIPELVAKAAAASSMRANPVRLTTEEMSDILTKALW